jgi:hypothetical protein
MPDYRDMRAGGWPSESYASESRSLGSSTGGYTETTTRQPLPPPRHRQDIVEGYAVPEGLTITRTTRAGRALRDKVLSHLETMFADGYLLDKAELDRRVHLASTVETEAELGQLFADLPGLPGPEPEPDRTLRQTLHDWWQIILGVRPTSAWAEATIFFGLILSVLVGIAVAVVPATHLMSGHASAGAEGLGAVLILAGAVWAIVSLTAFLSWLNR